MGSFEHPDLNLLQLLAWVYTRDRNWVDAASDRDPFDDLDDTKILKSSVLFAEVTVTDGDTALVAIGGQISFDDDGPSVLAPLTVTQATRDGSFGSQNDDTTTTNVAALFEGVANTGSDSGTGGLTRYAQSSGAVVSSSASDFGADEENGTMSFALSLDGPGGTDSEIDTPDGNSIFLFLEGGLVVGRVGNQTGAAAFAIAINSLTGVVSVAQYLSLTHGGGGDTDLVKLGPRDDKSFEDCERDILAALRTGRLEAIGIANDEGAHREVPRAQWAGLIFCHDPPGAVARARDSRPGSPRWSDLKFPSDTVLELWPPPEPIRSGYAGRPSQTKHLIEQEFQRRATAGEMRDSLADEVKELLNWLESNHPHLQPPTVKTLKNTLRAEHKKKLRSQRQQESVPEIK